jgi:hypothetical protein
LVGLLRKVEAELEAGADRNPTFAGALPWAFPLVEGLFGEAEHAAGHRDRDAVGGEVEDQREHQ